MKNLIILVSTLVFVSCGIEKQVVKKVNLNLDPAYKKIEKVAIGNDTHSEDQWSTNVLSLEKVWESYATSSTLEIMLLGTGVDYNHEDLQENILVETIKGKKHVGIDLVDRDHLAFDHFGHDTQMAGVLVASHNNSKGIKGVLKKASIYPVRYIDNNGRTNIILLQKALSKIVERKPELALLNLVNMSLSIGEENHAPMLRTVLKKIKELNIPVVIGAGNFASDMAQASKIRKVFSEFSNIVIVTGLDKGLKKPALSNFSNMHIHTAAPSENIYTTAKGNRYAKFSGTDYAAAYVTGALAYAISEFSNSKKTSTLIEALLKSEASTDNADLSSATLGRNHLNVAKYLNFLKNN